MSTNGNKAMPSREQVIREATYCAAVNGHYDTSEAAQKTGLLTITFLDVATSGVQSLPPGATHRFFVMINRTSCLVTRYEEDGRYEVEPGDQTEDQRQEQEIRESVLDQALWYLTYGGYHLGQGPEARATTIQALLGDAEPDQERDGGPVRHPIIRDERPDPPRQRQWSVQIGAASCEVGFFGYGKGCRPILVPVDVHGEDEDSEE